jgi:hypothetical protein
VRSRRIETEALKTPAGIRIAEIETQAVCPAKLRWACG